MTLTGELLRGYRMAVLEIASEMCLADHIGDAWCGVIRAAKNSQIEIPSDDNGYFDYMKTCKMLEELKIA